MSGGRGTPYARVKTPPARGGASGAGGGQGRGGEAAALLGDGPPVAGTGRTERSQAATAPQTQPQQKPRPGLLHHRATPAEPHSRHLHRQPDTASATSATAAAVAASAVATAALSAATPPPPPLLAPAESLRLLDGNWAFDATGAAKILSDAGSDFRVIGVIGTQGANKSTLLNALLYDSPASAATAAAAAGSPDAAAVAAAAGGGAAQAPVMPPFAVGGAAAASAPAAKLQAAGTGGVAHCTSRLELRVHPGDRTVFLDSPPLWSASVAAELATNPEPPLLRGAGASGPTILSRALADARARGAPGLPAEGATALLGLQLGALMLAACHVVVLMVDAVDEPRLWEYLQVVDMVAHSLPHVATAAAAAAGGGGAAAAAAALGPAGVAAAPPGGPRRVAELVVVLTGVEPDALHPAALAPQAELLAAALAHTRLLSACPKERAISVLDYLGRLAAPPRGHLLTAAFSRGSRGAAGKQAEAWPPQLQQQQQQQQPAAVVSKGPLGQGEGGGDGTDASSGVQGRQGLESSGGAVQAQGRSNATAAGCGGSGDSGTAASTSGVLHFWALPRAASCDDLNHRRTALAPSSLLALLRSALLGLPRRPLAPPPASPASQLPATSPAAAAAASSSLPQLTEREWLRGLERLWSVELQSCAPLERYYLALQRSVYAGGGGWPAR